MKKEFKMSQADGIVQGQIRPGVKENQSVRPVQLVRGGPQQQGPWPLP